MDLGRLTCCALAAPPSEIAMTIEPKSDFKMRTISGPCSGVSYTRWLGGCIG
jgi:hypothetical protein